MTGTPDVSPGRVRDPPIGEYALIGDCQSVALVSRDGSIDWCSMPQIAMVDPGHHGRHGAVTSHPRRRLRPADARRSQFVGRRVGAKAKEEACGGPDRLMGDFSDRSVSEPRTRVAKAFRAIEQALYMVVALALGLSGVALFGYTIARFVADLGQLAFVKSLLGLLDGLLLVFIITELLHTVRAVIAENVLMTEPFLIVGIVAAIRRFIVISAEAQETIAGDKFKDLMLEMGILVAAVVSLGLTIFLLRHTGRTEPRPAHEPDTGQGAERDA